MHRVTRTDEESGRPSSRFLALALSATLADGVLVGGWYATDGDSPRRRRRRRLAVSGLWVAQLGVDTAAEVTSHPGGVTAWALAGTPPHERAFLLRTLAVAGAWTAVLGAAEPTRRRRLAGAAPLAHRRLGAVLGAAFAASVLPLHLARARGRSAARRGPW
ncbi:hypothetical protein [Pseudokineococcus sp. 1T1Z-3]|uniref:hypothetical protein n=1 Tax=Pseudokineococcus sp. 1T1Z-3 TaxID=3132745 RepID=UPI00309B1D0E